MDLLLDSVIKVIFALLYVSFIDLSVGKNSIWSPIPPKFITKTFFILLTLAFCKTLFNRVATALEFLNAVINQKQ